MSFRNSEQQQAAIAAANLENAKKTLVAFVYQKFPTLVQCEANSHMVVELVERWAGTDVVPTPELFLSMLDENGKDALSMLARQPVEQTRQQIVTEILSLLASKNDGRDGKFNSFNLRSEEKRMESWSLDALRTRLAEIRTKQEMASKPTSELKKFVAEAHTDTRKYPGFPTLAKTIVPRGEVRAVPLDAAYIKALDTFELKRLVRLYSAQQVNDRLAGRN